MANEFVTKQYLYKVYDSDNNYLETWKDVVNEPTWTQELNSAGSTTNVILARTSDSLIVSTESILDDTNNAILDSDGFPLLSASMSRNSIGAGTSVNHNNRVDIFVYYGYTDTIDDNLGINILDSDDNPISGSVGAPNGVCKFSGFISEINQEYGSNENTQVQITSFGYDLSQYPVVDSSGNTTVTFSGADPSNILKSGLDRFTANGGGKTFTTYASNTIDNTSTAVTYTFKVNDYKELLDITTKLAPSNWFYWIGLGDNLVRFRARPSTANHTFYLGKHIKSLSLRSYIADVVNDVLFTGAGDPALYKRYTVTPSSFTRRGLAKLSDSRVSVSASADILSQGEIDEKKNIQYRSTIEIVDGAYDIESIQMGDMVAFRNFDNYIDSLLLQIVGLSYTPDVVTLQLNTLPPTVPKRLEELRRAVDTQENETAPSAPS